MPRWHAQYSATHNQRIACALAGARAVHTLATALRPAETPNQHISLSVV